MKINRAQDVHNVPDWVTAGTHLEAIERNAELLRAGVDRLNVTASAEVDDVCLFEECDQIEKCASSGGTYYYNSTWSPNHVGHLREYASVCGLPLANIVGIDPTSVIEKQASSAQMVKTASAEPQESTLENALKEVLGDPFHIEERSNMDHMKKANWEQIAPEARLSDSPDIAMMGGIMPLRGGEDYRIANQPGLAPNQNSIVDPGALDRLWNSEKESNGERLAREAKERMEQREVNHKAWEQEKIMVLKLKVLFSQRKSEMLDLELAVALWEHIVKLIFRVFLKEPLANSWRQLMRLVKLQFKEKPRLRKKRESGTELRSLLQEWSAIISLKS
jgi:hypothetical protein